MSITIRGLEIFFSWLIVLEIIILAYVYLRNRGKSPSED
jgi:hypothetical protein